MATNKRVQLLITIENNEPQAPPELKGWADPVRTADAIRENLDEYIGDELGWLGIHWTSVRVSEIEEVPRERFYADFATRVIKVVK